MKGSLSVFSIIFLIIGLVIGVSIGYIMHSEKPENTIMGVISYSKTILMPSPLTGVKENVTITTFKNSTNTWYQYISLDPKFITPKIIQGS